MMVNEADGLQLPPALRTTVNSDRGRKFIMVNQDKCMQLPPANSRRGRKFVMVNEEDGLQLPPALRIAANSGRGKKQQKHDERMILKNDAKAMRLRLAQMDGKTDSVLAAKSLSIDSNLTFPAVAGGIEGKRCASSGKYSDEVLHKKIKKAEKMLEKSATGSKEFKGLQKKLIEYRAQLKQQNQHGDSDVAMNGLFNLPEIDGKKWIEEKEQGTINSDTLSVEIVEEEGADENQIEGKAKEQKDHNTHSLEMLKKKLKKAEKMLHKSIPESKEFKKLQKKQMEYEKQIREHDAFDSITVERERRNRFQQSEKSNEVCGATIRYKPRLSWQRPSEMKIKDEDLQATTERVEEEFKVEQESQEEFRRLEKESKEKERDQYRHCGEHASEKRKVEDPKPKPPQFNAYTHFSGDGKLKKLAYLEEARMLKKEALEKKRQEEVELKKVKDKESTKKPFPLAILATEEIQSKNSEENEAFEHISVDHDCQRKKQAYLEEARRLKQEALEKKRKQEELHRKAEVNMDEEVNEKPSPPGVSVKEKNQSKNSEENEIIKDTLIDNDDQRKKRAYLEEARKLKREASEKKRKVEELEKKAEKDNEEDKKKSVPLGISATEEIQSKIKGEHVLVDKDTQRKKQAYLEEARKLKQEAIRKKIKDAEDIIDRHSKDDNSQKVKSLDGEGFNKIESIDEASQIHSADYQGMKPNFSATIQLKAEGQKEVEQENNSASLSKFALHTNKPNVLDEIKSKVEVGKEEKQEGNSTPSTDPATRRKNSNFLDDIKSKAEEKEDEQKYDSTPPTDSTEPIKILSIFDEIKLKQKMKKEDKKKKDCTSFSEGALNNKKSLSIFDEIKLKGKMKKEDKKKNVYSSFSEGALNNEKSNFLEHMKSKAEEGGGKQQPGSTVFSESTLHKNKPNFLEDIKSKAEGEKEEQQNDSTSFSEPALHREKLNFLEDIKSNSEGRREEKEQGHYSKFTDSATLKTKPNFLDEIKAKAERKKKDEQQNYSTLFHESISNTGKPNALQEMRLKVGGQKKDEQQDESTQTTDLTLHVENRHILDAIETKVRKQKEGTEQSICYQSSESSVSEKNSNAESAYSNVQQSEQTDERGTENVQSLTEEEALATPIKAQNEASKGYLDRRTLPEPLSNNSKKILRELESNENRQKKLERSLTQNGIRLTEEIPYEEAKDKIAGITDSMKALVAAGMDSYTTEKEYFRLEEQLSKYTTALMLTDEYAEEHRRLEQGWEDSIQSDNIAAIRKLRSHMPVKIRHLTEEELVTTTTPNGKKLPRLVARKFKRTNILQLLRVDPDDIEMMHPSLLEGMRTTSLTLTERRALHEHLRDVVGRWTEKRSDPSIEKKWQWYQSLKSKFKETLAAYLRCIEQFGPPGAHQYANRSSHDGGGCPLLGNQCPIKADAAVDYSDDYGYTTEAKYENSANRSESKKASPRDNPQSKEKSSKIMKSSEAENMQAFRDSLRLDSHETEVDKKLLRELFHSDKRTKNFEKQLTHAGLSLPKEDISYDVAKSRVTELTEELNRVAVNMGNTSDTKQLRKLEHTFGLLSQELDKYTNALMLTKEWAQEQKNKERQWEINVSAANSEALQKVRRHMPVNIRNLSETSLATDLTPNGKVLPKAIAKKFKRTNILMILRTDPSAIEVMHPSSLEAMRTTGLTLTERRAIHEHLKEIAPKWKGITSDKMCERKWMWHASLQSKFKEMLEKYDKDVDQYGHPGNHPYRKRNDPDGVGCPLIGNQCPIKADLVIDYSDDYGYPENAEYEQQIVAKSNLLSMEELEKRRLEDGYS